MTCKLRLNINEEELEIETDWHTEVQSKAVKMVLKETNNLRWKGFVEELPMVHVQESWKSWDNLDMDHSYMNLALSVVDDTCNVQEYAKCACSAFMTASV